MSLLINFITVSAWIWGALMAVSLLLNVFSVGSPEPREVELERVGMCLVRGILAWAWLLARYCM